MGELKIPGHGHHGQCVMRRGLSPDRGATLLVIAVSTRTWSVREVTKTTCGQSGESASQDSRKGRNARDLTVSWIQGNASHWKTIPCGQNGDHVEKTEGRQGWDGILSSQSLTKDFARMV